MSLITDVSYLAAGLVLIIMGNLILWGYTWPPHVRDGVIIMALGLILIGVRKEG